MALFKEMTDAGLREAYWSERALAANLDNMTKGARNPKLLRRASSGVLRSLRNIDIIVAIARKRGVSLTRPAGGKKRHGVAKLAAEVKGMLR